MDANLPVASTTIGSTASSLETDTAETFIEYTTAEKVLAAVKLRCLQEPALDGVLVTGVSAQAYADVYAAAKGETGSLRFLYLEKDGLLFITIPTGAHESAHLELYGAIFAEIVQMGLRGKWSAVGSTQLPVQKPGAGGNQGEGDSGGKPWPLRQDICWPTILIESGVSQTMNSLRTKMHFWFATSDHAIKIVLLVKLFRSAQHLRIEHWEESHVPIVRTGATRTRSAAAATARTPTCVRTIDLMWAFGDTTYDQATAEQRADPESFQVFRAPLRLGFEKLFLRQPQGPNEHDVVIDSRGLQYAALKIWDAVHISLGQA